MTTYQVISASAVSRKRNRYPSLSWPVAALAVGEAFIIPLLDGTDPDGRPEAYLRVLADKAGKRLGRKFSCNKVDGEGLAVSRIA
jgi:hypothetical protein